MKKIVSLFIIIIIFISANNTLAQVNDINQQIQEKQKQLEELNKKIEAYQKEITASQMQASTLRKQLTVLDDKIAKSKLDLQANELSLNTVTLQIEALTDEINHKGKEIEKKRSSIAELLRTIEQSDQQGVLEVVVLNGTLSGFFEQLNYVESLQGTLQKKVTEVKTVKSELERQENDLARYHSKLTQTRNQLELTKNQLDEEQNLKKSLLTQTKSSENKFQSLLTQSIQEQQKANADIKNLETQARKKINQQGSVSLNKLGDGTFIWPVNPYKGLSTEFHDPTYIFRKYFEHPGIDIPQPQGTGIKASADGYVAIARDAGLGYSYIMLVHKNGMATVYGHVSRIDVTEDTFVAKGQIIGATGGLPGTRGAGKLTTGPHLHFELRSNGIPINPMEYLP